MKRTSLFWGGIFILVGTLVLGCNSKTNSTSVDSISGNQTKDGILHIINQVNKHWQAENPQHGDSFWHRAAYHTGNMAAYHVTEDKKYKEFSEVWAEHNQWMGAKEQDKTKWVYNYGETDEYVLFGDFQTCFQVYIDLYNLNPSENKIARTKEVMEYQMQTPNSDYWWWADGLYMAMPVMTKLYKLTKNKQYLDKQYEYFIFAKDLMYDADDHLFYRGAKYIYPKHKTTSGSKDFWARGNGWAFAALAKVLEDLPIESKYRDEYITIYKQMAQSLKTTQQEEGYWSRSMLDADYALGYETSGTAFFAYGLLWGVNNGLLTKEDFAPVIERAWSYLTSIALQDDGTVGYVQPIGERADQHKDVGARTTADFGVGAFLLAASQMYVYCQ